MTTNDHPEAGDLGSTGGSTGRGHSASTVAVVFVACAVLAGGNGVCIRLSNRELAALWGAALRFALAAAVLWLFTAIRRFPIPRGDAFRGAVVYGLLNFAGAFSLAYYGLVRAPAGVGGALLALAPLLTLLLAAAQAQERLRRDAVLGGLLAVLGVAVLTNLSLSGSVPWLSLLALLGSVFCFAEAAVVARRFPRSHPVSTNAIGMTVASLALLCGSLAAGDPIELPRRAATWFALLYLVPVGSVAVFVLFLVLLRHWEASRAVYVDVVIPIVTTILAAWILDEPVGFELVLGGLLILSGVYLGALRHHAPT